MSEDQEGLEAESRNQLQWLFHLKSKLWMMWFCRLKMVGLHQEEAVVILAELQCPESQTRQQGDLWESSSSQPTCLVPGSEARAERWTVFPHPFPRNGLSACT